MRKIGYIRVSSEGQNTAHQKEQLQALNLNQIGVNQLERNLIHMR